MVEKIEHNNELFAMIIRGSFDKPGITFFTQDDFSQQLAYMHHPPGKIIDPHIHNAVIRQVSFTQEVLYIKKGRLRVDFYSEDKIYLKSRLLEAGDFILLIKGGHGFEVLEDLIMIEVKQGPYVGDYDKVRFHNKIDTPIF